MWGVLRSNHSIPLLASIDSWPSHKASLISKVPIVPEHCSRTQSLFWDSNQSTVSPCKIKLQVTYVHYIAQEYHSHSENEEQKENKENSGEKQDRNPTATILNHSAPCPAARTCDGIIWAPKGYLSPLPPALPPATDTPCLQLAFLGWCSIVLASPTCWSCNFLPSQFHTMEPPGRDSGPATHHLALTAPWSMAHLLFHLSCTSKSSSTL